MNWVKERKLPAIEAVQFNGQPYIELSDLWSTLHKLFNSTQSYQVDIRLLEEISSKEGSAWAPFSKEELLQAIEKCNNSSLLWQPLVTKTNSNINK